MEALEAPVPVRPSAAPIPWPFDRVRGGQSDFLTDARRAIADGRHLLAHAPTGIGKTAVALVASLDFALRANKLVLFLTSRQSQHRIAIETVRRIEAKGPRIATVDLIAKQSMCLQESAPAYGRAFHEFCDHKVKSRTCAFFTRDNSAVVTAVLQRTLHVQELVRASAACRVCPHKVAMDAAARANLVVCDYNYLFSEILERFLPRLGRSLDDLVLIVDEAHNLPDRIRAHLGGDLSVHDLLKAAKEARSIDGEVAHRLVGVAKAIEHFLLVVRSERVARKEELLDLVEEGLAKGRGGSLGYTDFVEMVAFAGEDAVRRGLPSALPEVAEFLTRWREQDVGILRLVVPGHEGKFAFRLMDPSVLSKRVFDRVHASVLMSGTLYPAGMYADLLGIDHAHRMIRTYGSPFPKTNRLLLVHPELTTLYAKRSAQMHDRMAQQIAAIAAAVPGNVALFFPSYELLEEAHSRFLALRVGKRILVERPEWTKAQRDGSIEALRVARREGGAVLFAVQGGSLSEGIDYEGNVLAAVVVVGLPLSPPNVEVEALKDYYCRKFGFEKGYDYAYVFPAVNKVLQAAGRPIRSERDRAAIILLEGRLLEPRYARCLPPDFDPRPSKEPAPEVRAFLEAS
ncbi:MAG TPA: ATP-dependent DNA helicase [Thermoplasmata archaeon]|nr:ATP-dependent DNA helicase [Thermoplasmata archaeon]